MNANLPPLPYTILVIAWLVSLLPLPLALRAALNGYLVFLAFTLDFLLRAN